MTAARGAHVPLDGLDHLPLSPLAMKPDPSIKTESFVFLNNTDVSWQNSETWSSLWPGLVSACP